VCTRILAGNIRVSSTGRFEEFSATPSKATALAVSYFMMHADHLESGRGNSVHQRRDRAMVEIIMDVLRITSCLMFFLTGAFSF
jgi:hypothetical protein